MSKCARVDAHESGEGLGKDACAAERGECTCPSAGVSRGRALDPDQGCCPCVCTQSLVCRLLHHVRNSRVEQRSAGVSRVSSVPCIVWVR